MLKTTVVPLIKNRISSSPLSHSAGINVASFPWNNSNLKERRSFVENSRKSNLLACVAKLLLGGNASSPEGNIFILLSSDDQRRGHLRRRPHALQATHGTNEELGLWTRGTSPHGPQEEEGRELADHCQDDESQRPKWKKVRAPPLPFFPL